VTVEGYVTVAPGTFTSATGEAGFALADDTGGLYISAMDRVALPVDAHVRVTGVMGQLHQLRVVETTAAAGVTLLTGTRTVAPMAVATGGVDESVEGRLVSVSGTLTREIVDDAPYGLKVYIDDGSGEVQVFVHLVGGVGVVDTAGLTLGSSIAVVGLAAQYETTYEVAPRVAADLVRR
jgi:hypothetical protein